jgi:hypothetical protein
VDVKQQYFGDARDYFKYDVLERLASDLGMIERLTCLWMLTAPTAPGREGSRSSTTRSCLS